MLGLLKYAKYIPMVIEAIKALESLIRAAQVKFAALKKNDHGGASAADIQINKQSDVLVGLVHEQLPIDVQMAATKDEMYNFGRAVNATISAVIELVDAAVPLLSGNKA